MIRTLEPGDRTDWLGLWKGYQRFYRVEIPDEVCDETFRRLLDPAEPMFAALAIQDGVPVGLVHFLHHRSTWTRGDYCYLQDLFVSETVRGAGLGRRLIDHVFEAAANAGCSRVHWLTHETNKAAMGLYDQLAERSGFVQYRRILE